MREYGKSGIRKSLRNGLGAALAVSAVLLPGGPWAGSGGKRSTDSGWIKGLDTAWHSPYMIGGQPGRDPSSGTGPGPARGMGGSGASDSGYLRGDSLWSSPYEGPATPGTGLPGKSGYGWPATGPGSGSGTGGSGKDGPGIPRDSLRLPRTGPSPETPGDTIGTHEWMERG